MNLEVKRGDVYYADLSPTVGSEQSGNRPVLIIQNNVGNKHSATVIVAPITSRTKKKPLLPTHIQMQSLSNERNSIVLLEQIRTLDKTRLKEMLTHIPNEEMNSLSDALMVSLGLIGEEK